MRVYRIQRKSDGKFSMGSMFPTFNKDGKIWLRRGDLLKHLRMFDLERVVEVYRGCVVVEYVVTECDWFDPISMVRE